MVQDKSKLLKARPAYIQGHDFKSKSRQDNIYPDYQGVSRRIQVMIQVKQTAILDTEMAMTTACEAHAVRRSKHRVQGNDQDAWNKATRSLYLSATMHFHAAYQPRMRHLRRDIEILQRMETRNSNRPDIGSRKNHRAA